jgi:hypothetical protein
MEKGKNLSSDCLDYLSSSLRPETEEGWRLMRAFFGIRQPALRQAILTLVTELQHLGARPDSVQRNSAVKSTSGSWP